MSFFRNMRNLFGVGPLLIFLIIIIESITLYAKQWISLPIPLSFNSQMILTIPLLFLSTSGIVWTYYSLRLIKVNFLGKEKKLVIHGPFCYVRHPVYSILVFILPLLTMIWFAELLFLFSWVFIFIVASFIVKLEEQELVKQFGESYKRYLQYVPALLPYKGNNGKRHYYDIMPK